MKRTVFLFSLCYLLLSFSTSISESVFNEEIKINLFNPDFSDSLWNVKPIAKPGDPAPGVDGKFLDFGTYQLFESGKFIFWAKFQADKKSQFWGLYSYKDDSLKLLQIEGTASTRPADFDEKIPYTQMGGVNKFHYTSMNYYQSVGRAWYIAMSDGNKLDIIIKPGDNIVLHDGRTAIIDYAEVVRNSKENAVIYFISNRPEKINGWLIHDGNNLKPLILHNKEKSTVPGGLHDKSISNFWGYPYISGDSAIIVTSERDNQLHKSSILRVTNSKTEKILSNGDPHPLFPDIKINNPQAFSIQNAQKFLVTGIQDAKKLMWNAHQSSLLYYNQGQWKSIIEDVKALPESKGFDKYVVDGSLFIGQKKDSILFSISLINEGGTYPNTFVAGRLPLLMLYDGNTLTNIPWYVDLNGVNLLDEFNPKRNSFVPITLKKITGFDDFIIKIPWSYIPDPQSLPTDFSPGTYLFNPNKEMKLIKIPQLNTTGSQKFTLASIIGWIGSERMAARSGTDNITTGFYELSLK